MPTPLTRHEKPVTYRLILPEKFSGSNRGSIQCLVCGLYSYNPNDVAHRYCPSCNVFHEEQPRDDEPHPAADLTIPRTWQGLMQWRMEEYCKKVSTEGAEWSRAFALTDMLSMTVPFKIHDLAVKGGPDDSDWARCREYSEWLGVSAPSLMFHNDGWYPKDDREPERSTREMIPGLIHAMAVMAFQPGGVCCLGVYFDAGAPDLTGVSQPVYGVLPTTQRLLEELWREKAEVLHA
jgi:hypothetical protein